MTREEAKEIISRHHLAFASMPDEVIEAIECLAEECEDTISFPKGTLKKRGKGYVVYDVEWLKKNWRTELRVMGIECEDAISRQSVIDTTICEGISCNECSFNTLEDGESGCLLSERVKRLPSATPKQRIGHWVKISPAGIYECSECGQNVMTGDIDAYRHCHGCGAKMSENPTGSESED